MTDNFTKMTEFELGNYFAFQPARGADHDMSAPASVLLKALHAAPVTVHEDLAAAMRKSPKLKTRFEALIAKLRAGGELEGGPVRHCPYCPSRRRVREPLGETCTDPECNGRHLAPGKHTCGGPKCEKEHQQSEADDARRASMTRAEREAEDEALKKKLRAYFTEKLGKKKG